MLGWVLSGHTHGGQYVVPGWGAPVTFSQVATRRHPAGWVPNARAPLFVSRGVGVQAPGRLFAGPEVVVVTLTSTSRSNGHDGHDGACSANRRTRRGTKKHEGHEGNR